MSLGFGCGFRKVRIFLEVCGKFCVFVDFFFLVFLNCWVLKRVVCYVNSEGNSVVGLAVFLELVCFLYLVVLWILGLVSYVERINNFLIRVFVFVFISIFCRLVVSFLVGWLFFGIDDCEGSV